MLLTKVVLEIFSCFVECHSIDSHHHGGSLENENVIGNEEIRVGLMNDLSEAEPQATMIGKSLAVCVVHLQKNVLSFTCYRRWKCVVFNHRICEKSL